LDLDLDVVLVVDGAPGAWSVVQVQVQVQDGVAASSLEARLARAEPHPL